MNRSEDIKSLEVLVEQYEKDYDELKDELFDIQYFNN
jgi:hypothetical protein